MAVTRIKKSKKNTSPAQDQPNFLDSLPTEVLKRITNLVVEKKDISALARVNNEFGQALFQPKVARFTSRSLVHYLSEGQLSNVKAILKCQPALLLKHFTFTNARSGHRFVRITPFQFAYGEGDTEMCNMMLSIVKKNPIINVMGTALDMLGEIKQQIITRFIQDCAIQDVYKLRHIVRAITEASHAEIDDELALTNQSNSAIRATLDNFRQTFKLRVFSGRMHFNMQDLVDAYALQKRYAPRWTQQRTDLFWRQVIGYMQSLLPVCDLQAINMTLYRYISHSRPLNRVNVDNLFTGEENEEHQLGFHFALDQKFDRGDLIPIAGFVKSASPNIDYRLPDTFHPANFIEKFAEKKIKAMQKLNLVLGLIQDNEPENARTHCTIS